MNNQEIFSNSHIINSGVKKRIDGLQLRMNGRKLLPDLKVGAIIKHLISLLPILAKRICHRILQSVRSVSNTIAFLNNHIF